MEIKTQLTIFAFQVGSFVLLVGPPEEGSTAIAADSAVVRVMDFSGGSFIAADGTESFVGNFWNVRVDEEVD